jgi:hypothetical protein
LKTKYFVITMIMLFFVSVLLGSAITTYVINSSVLGPKPIIQHPVSHYEIYLAYPRSVHIPCNDTFTNLPDLPTEDDLLSSVSYYFECNSNPQYFGIFMDKYSTDIDFYVVLDSADKTPGFASLTCVPAQPWCPHTILLWGGEKHPR